MRGSNVTHRDFEKIASSEFQSGIDPRDNMVCDGILPLKPIIRADNEMGCFVHGVEILLANGKQKPIQDLNTCTPGDHLKGDVLLSFDGRLTYVVALSGGPQPVGWQLVAITAKVLGTNKEHSVVVTKNHCFGRGQSGVIQSQYLREGDIVRSEAGESVICKTAIVDYSGELVWNVYLASEQFVTQVLPKFSADSSRFYALLASSMKGAWLDLGPRDHLMSSNGFCTGDLALQLQLDSLEQKGHEFTEFL